MGIIALTLHKLKTNSPPRETRWALILSMHEPQSACQACRCGCRVGSPCTVVDALRPATAETPSTTSEMSPHPQNSQGLPGSETPKGGISYSARRRVASNASITRGEGDEESARFALSRVAETRASQRTNSGLLKFRNPDNSTAFLVATDKYSATSSTCSASAAWRIGASTLDPHFSTETTKVATHPMRLRTTRTFRILCIINSSAREKEKSSSFNSSTKTRKVNKARYKRLCPILLDFFICKCYNL